MRCHLVVVLLAFGACHAPTSARAPAGEGTSAQERDVTRESTPVVTSPSGAAALMDRLRSCQTVCCLGGVPLYVWGWAPDVTDAASLAEARAIMKGPAPARVRAIAALRLGAEMRPKDVALLAPLVRSEEDVGELPFERPEKGQAMPACPAIEWSRRSLGLVVLYALHRVTGGRFRTVDEFDAWFSANRDLESSVEYWMGALAEASHRPTHLSPSSPTRFEEMLASLQARPEILVRVSLALS